jgi:PKD repeat protein
MSTAEVTVNNVAPEVRRIELVEPMDPVVPQEEPINLSGFYTDPSSVDFDMTMWEWDWGDGSKTSATTSDGTVEYLPDEDLYRVVGPGHDYTTAGVYAVQFTVTDPDGGTGTATFDQYIVVYDPSAGFVTGGGWILSPEEACQLDGCTNDTTGKASFGFVSKYKQGATEPDGNTQFQFKAGNLNFHSTSYQWLVVAGFKKAKFKGTGTINGGGNYGFMLTALDGDVKTKDDQEPDGFRIVIWDKDSGDAVVYDNLAVGGIADDDYRTQPLAGGSITIHNKKGK